MGGRQIARRPPFFSTAATAAALAALAALPFARTVLHPFVRFDDYEYVLENPFVRGGLSWDGVREAFTSFHMGYWIPATWLSHMADVSVFGLRPGGHHLVNVLLHAAAVAALYVALCRLTGRPGRSALAAALFGVHPLRVESVAWVAERKDVLSALCFALTLLAWVRYLRRPGPGRYLAALLIFAAGLLAKPMVVTLPAVLLLLDHWPLGRLPSKGTPRPAAQSGAPWPLLLEKGPFLLLSVAVAGLTLFSKQQSGIMKGLGEYSPGIRAANAVVAAAAYLGKTVWPVDLAVFYPHPGSGLSLAQVGGALALLAAVTVVAFRQRARLPYLAVGWGWFLVMLLPVSGLFQAGLQAGADRFTYLPHAGLFLGVVWLGAERAGPGRAGRKAVAAAAGLVALLAAGSFAQAAYWRDSVTLFGRALEAGGESWLTRTNLGVALLDEGRAADAVASFDAALRLRPGYALALYNRGVALEALGVPEEAVESYREAVRSDPGYAAAHLNLGAAAGRAGRTAEAVRHLVEAVRLAPRSAAAHYNLGLALELEGRVPDALERYREAARLQPRDREAAAAAARLAVRPGRVPGGPAR